MTWPLRGSERRVMLGLAVLCTAQLLLYVRTSLMLHANLQTHAYDLGIFGQAVNSYAHLDWPASTLRQQENLLGDHFSPVLVLLVPLWWVHDDVRTLLVAQAALVVSATPAVWLYARHRLGHVMAFPVAVLFALYFGIQHLIGFDFHEVAFAVPLMAWGLYLADRGRLSSATACFCALMLVKENLAAVVVVFGICLVVRYRAHSHAAFCVAFGVLSYVLVTGVLMPRINSDGFLYWPLEYGHLGATPLEGVRTLLRDPRLLMRTLFTPEVKLDTLVQTFIGFACLPLLSSWALLTAPMLAERFLGLNERRWTMGFHYSALLAPVLAAGLVDTVARLRPMFIRLVERHWSSPGRRWILGYPTLLVLLLPLGVSPTWTGAPVAQSVLHPLRATPEVAACRRMIESTPAGVPVEATRRLAPHLVPRNPVWLPLRSGGRARIVLVDRNTPEPIFRSESELGAYLRGWMRKGYLLTFDEAGCVRLELPKELPLVVTSRTPYSVGSNTDASSLDPRAPARISDAERR